MNIQTHTLSSGIPAILIPIEGRHTFTQVCGVRGGSMYETEKTSGISHMLEHVLFKGTKKRPTAKEIAVELDMITGDYNAFTGFESIAFYANSITEYFEQITDVMSDQLINSVLNPAEIEKEKGAVLEELRGAESDPYDKVTEILPPLIYGDQAAGRSILGTEETVLGFTRRQIKDAMSRFFNKSNMFLVVAGSIPEEDATLKLLDEYYGDVREGIAPRKHKVREPNQKEAQVVIEPRDIQQSVLALGINAPSPRSKQSYVLKVLMGVLGLGMSSRLFHEVREERGLAYYIYTTSFSKADSGNMAIMAGINAQKVPEALDVIKNELVKISEEYVSEDELEKVKNMVVMQLKMRAESSSSMALSAIKDLVTYGHVRAYEDILNEFVNVTAEDVAKLAQQMFVSSNLNLAAVGPHTKDDEATFKDAITF